MAIAAPRDLKIGKIIDKTLGVIERTALPALIFVIVVTALCAPISWFTVGSLSASRLAGGELLKAVIGIVAAYFLIVPMLRRAGLHTRSDADAFLPFIGLSVLSALGVLLGFIAFIIPGLFVMARWSIAQPLLVGQGTGVMESLGESWERTRGNEFSIIIAALALALAPIVVMIATAVGEQRDERDLPGDGRGHLWADDGRKRGPVFRVTRRAQRRNRGRLTNRAEASHPRAYVYA